MKLIMACEMASHCLLDLSDVMSSSSVVVVAAVRCCHMMESGRPSKASDS